MRDGWVMDFADIGKAFAPLHARLDHSFLNDIAGLSNPTCENVAQWIWQQLKLPGLSKVVLAEGRRGSSVYYTGT
jgi:6-pyruvoyltetrahydropterin/6-carboxytetrahydropterin synthase